MVRFTDHQDTTTRHQGVDKGVQCEPGKPQPSCRTMIVPTTLRMLMPISIALDLSMRCAPRNTDRNIAPMFPIAHAKST